MAYIYADLVHGCILDDADGVDSRLEINVCNDMEDVRSYLKDMDDQKFERILKVPDSLLPQVQKEYGIGGYSQDLNDLD